MMLFRLYRNRVNREAKRLRRTHYEQCLNSICANSGRWWSDVREITGRTNTGCSLQGLANLVCDGSMDALADSINSYLQSVTRDFTPITSNDDFTIGHDTPDHVPDKFIIHVQEVERKLSRINTSKAMGPDDIPSWIWKDCSATSTTSLCSLQQRSEGRVRTNYVEVSLHVPHSKSQPTHTAGEAHPPHLTDASAD